MSFQSRQAHLKKCGLKLEIPTDVVIRAVTTQEKEYKAQIEAGILPKEFRLLSLQDLTELPGNNGYQARVEVTVVPGSDKATVVTRLRLR